MIVSKLALCLLLFSKEPVLSFTPSGVSVVKKNKLFSLNTELLQSDSKDISVPYDAAARVEYDAWREKYSKGPFDPERFRAFKANYEALTVANVKAYREVREKGSNEDLVVLELNEYADMTEEEFNMLMSGNSLPSSGDVLSEAMQAAASQNEAASALMQASSALAEEEEILAQKLGLENIEELETALDALDGIADDGGDLDTTAREARVRAAYLEWCRDFDRQPDSEVGRFQIFMDNYLKMEAYAKENGVTMKLNQFADLSEEEYIAATTTPVSAPPVQKQQSKFVPPPIFQTPTDDEILARREEIEARKEERRVQELEEALAREEERKKRQLQQEREAEKIRLENEAIAIAAAKEAADREAMQIKRRRENELMAAEMERKKARAAQAIANEQLRLAEEKRLAALAKSEAAMAKVAAEKAEKEAQRLAQLAEGKARKEAAVAAEAKKKAQIEAKRKALAEAQKANAPKKAKPSPTFTLFSPRNTPSKEIPKPPPQSPRTVTPKKPAPTFSLDFFSKKPIPASKPTPAPAPIPPSPSFSLFSPAKKQQVEPPQPKVEAKSKPTFNFFTSPKSKPVTSTESKVKEAEKIMSNAKPRTTISLFGLFDNSSTVNAPPGVAVLTNWVRNPDGSVSGTVSKSKSFRNGSKITTSKIRGKATPGTTVATMSGSKYFLDADTVEKFTRAGYKPSKASATIDINSRSAEQPQSSGFNFFGGGSAAAKQPVAPPGVPRFTNWRQNRDGSITGNINGSSAFKPNERVTTSKITVGEVKPGSIVKTASGSRYFLS